MEDTRMQYSNKRIDIQILRGVAVISVFLYHFSYKTFPNGFLGVDIFFIISGLLVCSQLDSILEKSLNGNLNYELKSYFLRRLLRILPALSVFLIFAIFFVTLFLDSDSNSQFTHLKHAFQALLSVYNFDLLQHSSDYFRSEDPLLNLWSLSVEVQTYLILTLLAMVTVRISGNGNRRQGIFRRSILGTGIGSAFLCWAVVEYSRYFQEIGLQNLADGASFINFYSPLSRLWEFSLGGIIAFYLKTTEQSNKPKSNTKKNASLLVLAFLLSLDISGNRQITLVLIIAVTFLFLSSPDYSRESKFLESLEWIGNRSYSIYLYHLICISLVLRMFHIDTWAESLLSALAAGCLTLILGSMSFRHIELRFNSNYKGKRRATRTPIKLISTITTLTTFTISLIFSIGTILPQPDNSDSWNSNYAASNKTACPLGHDQSPCEIVGGFSKDWLIVGDSHAGALQLAVGEVAKSQGVNLLAWNQCLFFDPELLGSNTKFFPDWCLRLNKNRVNYLKENQISALFIAYQYSPPRIGDSEMSNSFYKNLISKSIERVPSEIQVFEFSQVPEYRDSIQSSARFARKARKEESFKDLLNNESLNTGRPKRNRDNYTWIDLTPAFCSKVKCSRFKKEWLYVDNNHLSIRGANETIPLIITAFKENKSQKARMEP